ncbi:MAG TPA: glycoside hydrolase family 13 protein [Tessaracoccus flavescens]|uniref:Glycoside hydrolase family 13 protein n=1 Tax=Tessaracoccus flavescens TaxID=399497 RepID=A0A921EMP9_9ACTN|nr:glycoside hydrolase family 13 protein [Tessaracoccus flavescens]
MHLLGQPHHDPSALFVSNPRPALGERIALRMRVPGTCKTVALRYLHDGEGSFVEATPVEVDGQGSDQWWQVEVTVDNPTLQYRWILIDHEDVRWWLNGEGVFPRDVTDAADFRLITTHAPAWTRGGAVVYQIFPDRFARSAGADGRELPDWAHGTTSWDEPMRTYETGQHRQIYGGDLDGIVDKLDDHVAALRASVLYLTPFFSAQSNHRYNATTFEQIDDLLGGDEALDRLISEAHRRGMRVLGDFTPNHTGSAHEWFLAAQANPDAPESTFYYWTDEAPGYACWLGFKSLPKLNHASPELTERLFGDDGVIRRWLRKGLDGWRVDVANMTGRIGGIDLNREVAARFRHALDAEGDRWLLAEHFYDLHHDVDGATWHGAMNYAAFSRPLWAWLEVPTSNEEDKHFSVTKLLPSVDGAGMVETMQAFMAQVPWAVTESSLNIVGSHDTGRIMWRVGSNRGRVEAALGMAYTMPGVPMLYYGDEIGLEGNTGEYGRRPFPWQAPDTWDQDLLGSVIELGRLREELTPIHDGGLRWVHAGPNAVAYVRESADGGVLALASRDACDPIDIPVSLLPGSERGNLVFGKGISLDGDTLRLAPVEAGFALWHWANHR